MGSKTVSMLDRAGHFLGVTEADESPLEPGVFHHPSGTVDTLPPGDAPEGKRWRWNGSMWELIVHAPAPENAVLKLQHFLAANPDVAALLG